MRDALEQQLAARLRDLADAAPESLDPPLDLDLRVRRRQRVLRRRKAVVGFAAAAAIVGVVTLVAVVTAPAPTVDVAEPASEVDRGAVMLNARDTFVVAIDETAHQRSTLVTADRGNLSDAQLTNDRRTLWYLSIAGIRGASCGEIVRADVMSGASRIVGHGLGFAVNPAGTRVAVISSNASPDDCAAAAHALPAIAWTPDGSRLVRAKCAAACEPVRVYAVIDDAEPTLRRTSVPIVELEFEARQLAFGPDALYAVDAEGVLRWFDADTFRSRGRIVREPVEQVIPTAAGTYVLRRSSTDAVPALFRVDGDELRFVRAQPEFGTLTPVPARPR